MFNKNKFLKSLPALLVVGAVVIVGGLAALPGKKNAQDPTPPPPVNVEVMTLTAVPTYEDTFTLPAVVEPERTVKVAAEVAGRIDRLVLEEGRACTKGQELVVLNKDLLKAEYDRAKAQAEFDGWQRDRTKELVGQNAATQNELALTASRARASEAALRLSEEQLRRSVIVAPVDGILNRLPVEVGEYVTAGMPVAEIVNIGTVRVVVQVPEQDIQYLRIGQEADVLPDATSVTGPAGQIAYISEVADEMTRTTRVEIEVANAKGALRGGQVLRARLTRQVLHDVLMIPLQDVIPQEDGKSVYVAVDGKAEQRAVEIELKRNPALVLPGSQLKAGDQLIEKGKEYVSPGQAVRVVASVRQTPPGEASTQPQTTQPAPQSAPASQQEVTRASK